MSTREAAALYIEDYAGLSYDENDRSYDAARRLERSAIQLEYTVHSPHSM